MIFMYCSIFFSLVWLLAVYKVFILDDGIEYTHKIDENRQLYRAAVIQATETSIKDITGVTTEASTKEINYVVHDVKKIIPIKTRKIEPIVSPQNQNIIASHELKWPPVLPDGSIPPTDGHDVMPFTGLEVPKFWSAPEGSDLNTVGSKVDGHETIFLMIASYRDFQCRETITKAYARADHPERLYVAAVDQVIPGDVGCLDIEIPCSVNADQPICKYRDQISVYKMDAKFGTGPVTARHVGDRMYRGEYFVMQMDAHCHFVSHWDTKIIDQWRSTHNEMAVLSSYLTDIQGSLDANFDSTRNSRPIMCNSDFEGEMPARYLRHGAQPEEYAAIRDMPQLEPYWAAGFSFSRGHFKLRVPYDGYQPMVFQGEEISIGIRGFTHGYDFYAPRDSVVFHEYASMSSRRKKVPGFWENSPDHAGEMKKSLRRSTSIIGMATDIDPASWDHREEQKYGLGKVRELSQFYDLFLIDVKNRKAVQLCPFVSSGVMHKDFQPFLRSDGLGIDYTRLKGYNTQASLSEPHKQRMHPFWERQMEEAVELRDKAKLELTVKNAVDFGLDQQNPTLVAKAKSLISVL